MTVQFVIEAKDKNVSDALQRMTSDMEKLREQNKKLADESKRGNDESKKAHEGVTAALREQISEYVKVKTGIGAIEYAVDFVKDAYSEWRAELKRIADEHKRVFSDIIRDLSTVGELQQAPKITKALEGFEGVTLEQAKESYGGVTSAVPGAPVDRKLELAHEATRTGTLGFDQRQFGSRVGVMSQLAPASMAANDVVDVTAKMQSLLGNSAGEMDDPAYKNDIRGLMAAGYSFEQANALFATAASSGISTKAVHQFVEGLTKKYELHRATPNKPLDTHQRAENRLRTMTPSERAQVFLNERDTAQELLGNADIAEIGGQAAIDRTATGIAAAGPEDFVQQQIEQLSSFPAGIQQRADYEQQLRNERAERELAFKARKGARADQFIEEVLNRRKANPIERALVKGGQNWLRLFNSTPDTRIGDLYGGEYQEEFQQRETEVESRMKAAREAAGEPEEISPEEADRRQWNKQWDAFWNSDREQERSGSPAAAGTRPAGRPPIASDPAIADEGRGGSVAQDRPDPNAKRTADAAERTAAATERIERNQRAGRGPQTNTHVEQ